MEWVADEVLTERVLEWIRKGMDEDRPEISVTSMIGCLSRTYYRNHFLPIDLSPRETMLFSTGLGLERVMLGDHQKSDAGEEEGISYHVDHIGDDGLIEVKSTRISTKRPPEEFSDSWKKQILAYMYALGIEQCGYVIIHLMGNYSPPFPTLATYQVRATQAELKDNWQYLLERKAEYEEFVKIEEVPTPFKYNEDWECNDCGFKALCDAKRQGF